MDTLTPVRRLFGLQAMNTGCPGQVSPLSSRIFRTFRLQTPLTFPIALFGFSSARALPRGPTDNVFHRHPSREVIVVTWASPSSCRLAKVTGRIEFTRVADGSFASGCSPPRLAATQLPPATKGQTSFRRGLTPRWFVNNHRRTRTSLSGSDRGLKGRFIQPRSEAESRSLG
jgi:hypothetical protein